MNPVGPLGVPWGPLEGTLGVSFGVLPYYFEGTLGSIRGMDWGLFEGTLE